MHDKIHLRHASFRRASTRSENGGSTTADIPPKEPNVRKHLRSILFSAALLFFTCGPIVLLATNYIDKSAIPPILTNEKAVYLEGAGPTTRVKDVANLDGFLSKDFQTIIDEKVGSFVPFKADAILCNAALQRSAIATSNLLFNWDCYPTFFSSDYIAVPSAGILLHKAAVRSESMDRATISFVEAVNHAQKDNPDVRFVYQSIDDTYSSAANPSQPLTSDALSEEWSEDVLSKLDADIKVTRESIKDADELRTQWYSSEHHWTIDRAIRAYNNVAPLLGLSTYDCLPLREVSHCWQGSSSRNGLCMDYPSTLWDTDADFSSLQVSIDGSSFSDLSKRGSRGATIKEADAGEGDLYAFYNYYHWYYGTPKREIIYRNDAENNGKTLLFVQQSYGVPLEPYFALNYATTICIDPSNRSARMTLNEYIDEYDVDDVVIQLGPIAYTNIAKNSSNLFE